MVLRDHQQVPPYTQYTTAQVAVLLNINRQNVIKKCASGAIKARQDNKAGFWRISAEALRDYLGVSPATPLPTPDSLDPQEPADDQ